MNCPVLAAATGLLLALSGCVSSDLSGDAKVRSEVALALPTDVSAPERLARAIWFPNGSGFGPGDWSPIGHPVGVLALAGGRLWFLTWDDSEHHYDVQRVIDVSQSDKVDVSRLGSSSMLVVESGNRSSDAFELMEGGQIASDPAATDEWCGVLRHLRAAVPAASP
jgi:hypothetical protein